MSSNRTKLIGILFPQAGIFWKCMLAIMAYTFAVVWFDDHYFPKNKFMEAYGAMATTSVVIGLLLAFRTNSAYDRWWEGRKLWGQLVNETRNLWLKFLVYVEPGPEQKEEFRRLLAAFPYALKGHLRDDLPNVQMPSGVDPAFGGHPPLHIAGRVFAMLADCQRQGRIDALKLQLLDQHARALMDVCGACERIKKSPIAGSYKTIIWLWLAGYLLVVPWLLTPTFDLWTLLIMFVGSYFVIALEMLAEEVEEPFGTESNDLPLDQICRTIEASLITSP